jgi:hypothetical protein
MSGEKLPVSCLDNPSHGPQRLTSNNLGEAEERICTGYKAHARASSIFSLQENQGTRTVM